MFARIILSVVALSLASLVQAAELSFQEDCGPITKSSSNVYRYQTENCPDISRFNSCVYHNGMKFSSFTAEMDMEARVESILNFYSDVVKSCTAACESSDLGACVILGRSVPPFNSMESGQQEFQRLSFLQKACMDGVVEACREAGYETDKIWNALSSADVKCPEPKFFTLREACDSPDTMIGYIKSNAIEIPSPVEFYARGCELEHGTSCRMLMNFYLENPDPSFDPADIVAQVCDFGNKLDCNGAKLIERKFN